MEFWSGVIGAIVGGAIALIGTIFASVYEHRCQREAELRSEKKKIYEEICDILSSANYVSTVINPGANEYQTEKIDAANFARMSEKLGEYMKKHAGHLILYLSSDLYSSLVRIRAELYTLSLIDLQATSQTFSSDFHLLKATIIKIFNLEAQLKRDLYPINRKARKEKRI